MANKQNAAKLLIAKLQLLVGKLNRFHTFLNLIDANNCDELQQKKLSVRLNQFQSVLSEYSVLSSEASVIHLEDESILSFDEFEEEYFDLISRASLLLEKCQNKDDTFSNQSLNNIASNSSNNCNVKLPILNIPSFSGQYTEWSSFFESFTALIHNNSKLSDVEKFYYLQNALKGSAKELINEMSPTSSNYHVALSMLKDRFDNKKLIIFSHLEAIFDTNKINKESATDLRKFQDTITCHLRALDNLHVSDEQFKAAVIAHVVKTKIDQKTAAEYSKCNIKQIPSLSETHEFLSLRCQMLEDINISTNQSHFNNVNKTFSQNNKNFKGSNFKQSFVTSSNNHTCTLCNEDHFLFSCPTFLKLTPQQRFDKANELNVCKNCLKHSRNSKCTSTYKCKFCQRPHNSLLCFKKGSDNRENTSNVNHNTPSDSNNLEIANNSDQLAVANTTLNLNKKEVLLSTAIVQTKGTTGNWLNARCLLDSASQANFISSELCSKLGYTPVPSNVSIVGINTNVSKSLGSVKIKIKSLQNNYQIEICCLVIPKITENLPLQSFNSAVLEIPLHIKLADATFNKSAAIDILIGATHFYELLSIGQISLGKHKPILQRTVLGWVISGQLPCKKANSKTISNVACANSTVHSDNSIANNSLHDSLARFWELEDVLPKNKFSLLSKAEQFCEIHFNETVTQDASGKIVVSIPFNEKLKQLGDSKQLALTRFYNLERKLSKDPTLHKEYCKFMKEYIDLGHATKVTSTLNNLNNIISTLDGVVRLDDIPRFYLPHHAVFKSNSLTTKVRVVFDGSAKSNTNVSINDTQIVGPVLQDDLFSILLRFRIYKIALTADCEKMYRMIKIQPHLRKLQSIFWREHPNQPLQIYELKTITYGMSASSYLATKSLQYLANKNEEKYPRTASIIKSCFYMDDLLFTAESLEEIKLVKDELITILSSAGISLRKFLSNNPIVMNDSRNTDSSLFTIPLGERTHASALGLSWNSVSDSIYFNVQFKNNGPSNSKRTILSTISKLFDPLGVLAPIIVIGKLLIQKLWELQISWDESIPEPLSTQWETFQSELNILNTLQIPRCVTPILSFSMELHGFSDSSSVAYGACIYVRCKNDKQDVSAHLLCAKSRIAPLRVITIPRLELCAAVLLTQLMQKVQISLNVDNSRIFLWSDSTVVLNWLNSAPNKYKLFIANRIAAAQERFPTTCWHHIVSEQNPADLISRGISVSDILNNSLWWNGPSFLSNTNEYWKNSSFSSVGVETSELKTTCLISSLQDTFSKDSVLFSRFSTFTKLQRVLAYILRFANNCRVSQQHRIVGALSTTDLQNSTFILVRLCQQSSFYREIKYLLNNKNLQPQSEILSLNPFLDEKQLLRVGGRITNSRFHYDKKHPLLLPKNHPLTYLIFKHFHINLLHCGSQQLLAFIREHYWPISGKNTAKKIIRGCIKCFKVNPVSNNPLMGNLPLKRLDTNTPAFFNTGLDYAGPILIKDRKLRGAKLIQAYICLFVCLTTRAIHLELVTDLTTAAFLNVLKRFIARRGKPQSISSDNAKNFLGAYRHLKELYKFFQLHDTQNSIKNYLHHEGIKWEFIIPRAPHQGGIWESAIKSAKLHLKKVLGNTSLTYEDLNTVLTQIESVLNSRPLSSLSSDPEDLSPLTPGHFLIGRSLCSLPDPELQCTNQNRLSLYQRTQQLMLHFWKRWSVEVVPELQKRTKWFHHLDDFLHPNSLVVIKEDNLPPLRWSLGRVLQVHRASDSVVRSVTLRTTGNTVIKRPVHKLCVLPL